MWAGAGGSLAFVDPEAGVSFAYVMNDLRFELTGVAPSDALVAAAHQAVARAV